MRLALVTRAYGNGDGVLGRHVQAIATEVAGQGGTVDVLLQSPTRSPLPEEQGRISVRSFPALIPGSQRAVSGALVSHLRGHARDFDLVHAHGESMLPALLMSRRQPRHLIFTPHYYASAQPHLRHMVQGRHHHIDRQILLDADRVLCVSDAEALQVQRYAPLASVCIVPNGFETAEIAAARPLVVQDRVILSVDRLTRWAGIQRLISALPALPESYRLVVIGSGRARGMLEAHADYLGVWERVLFLGKVSDHELYRWMHTASVVVTLKEESLWAGTLLTAACAGTPVLASDISVCREAAELAEVRGIEFVSRQASPFVVAEAIERLIDAGEASNGGHVPTWREMAERTTSIYREVLDDRC